MSKTLGNTIDPMCVINGNTTPLDTYAVKPISSLPPLISNNQIPTNIEQIPWGSDSLRMALLSCNFMSTDITFSEKYLNSAKAFEVKLVNALKWILAQVEKASKHLDVLVGDDDINLVEEFAYFRLGMAMKVNDDVLASSFSLEKGLSALTGFFLETFCGVFIEIAKNRFYDRTPFHMVNVFAIFLKSFHPYCPMLTEV